MKAERKLELVPLTLGLNLINGKVYETIHSFDSKPYCPNPNTIYCLPIFSLYNDTTLTGYIKSIGKDKNRYLMEAIWNLEKDSSMYIRRVTPFVKMAKEINSFITESQQPVLIPNLTVGGEEVKMVCRIRRDVNKEGYDSAKLEVIFMTPTNYMCFDRSMKRLDEFFNRKRDMPSKYLMSSNDSYWENTSTRCDFEKEYLAIDLSDHDPEQVYDQVSSYNIIEHDELFYVRNYVLERCIRESEKVCDAVKLVTADVEPRERVNQVIITEIFG